jgi:cysteine sulfinate desulfinase/cysteine desulfurase-like protein
MNQPGIRFTITRHNAPADIDAFADALSAAIDEARTRGDAEGRAA